MGGNDVLSANSKNIKQFELQQKAKGLITIAAVVLPLIAAAIAFRFYQNARTENTPIKQLAETLHDDQLTGDYSGIDFSTDGSQTEPLDATTDPNQPVAGGLPAYSSPTNSSGRTIDNGVSPASPDNSGQIPQGVVVILNSIESNGIKGSPYIADSLDTSMIPDGVVVRFNRSSWEQLSPNSGVISGTITISGQTNHGSVAFSQINGSWKATGYTL